MLTVTALFYSYSYLYALRSTDGVTCYMSYVICHVHVHVHVLYTVHVLLITDHWSCLTV